MNEKLVNLRPVAAARMRRPGPAPALRLVAWAVGTGIDRAWTGLRGWLAPQRRAELRQAWLTRRTARATELLGELKGVFVKAGQFAAHRHDLLPAEASRALAQLRDRVPPLPLEAIRPVVEGELGGALDTLFADFEPIPLGAASLAQVHRARLPEGETVAVKVQYPWLEASSPADVALLRRLFALLGGRLRLAPGQRRRLGDELAASLALELDFQREARVAAEIAANLSADPQIVVPRVLPAYSSQRVLTMAFHPAVPITDAAALERLGAEPGAVLEIVVRAYAKQIFVDGLFHADPHPGNLFVLESPDGDGRPRVLFVDFGLARRLDPELRRELRLGLYALVQRDPEAFLAGMRRLEMIAPGAEPAVRHAVNHMFARIGAEGGALRVAGAGVLDLKDEAKALLQQTPGLQLPDDLLLFARTLSYVFSLGRELAPEVDLTRLTLPYLLRFLAEKDAGAPGS